MTRIEVACRTKERGLRGDYLQKLCKRLRELEGWVSVEEKKDKEFLRSEKETAADPMDMVEAPHTHVNSKICTMYKKEVEQIKKRIKAVKESKKDEYRICSSCGKPISFARLMAAPFADTCTDCKTAAEKAEKITSHGGRY